MRRAGTISLRGAVLLELAISIPLLLLIAFFALWFCVVQNLRAQLDYVVTNAPFVAVGRGNPQFYANGANGGGIAAVNHFIENIPSNEDQLSRSFAFKAPGSHITEDALVYYGKNGPGDWGITGFDPDAGGNQFECDRF